MENAIIMAAGMSLFFNIVFKSRNSGIENNISL